VGAAPLAEKVMAAATAANTRHFGLTAFMITIIFAAYVLCLLLAL
jgi:hypothetical protein